MKVLRLFLILAGLALAVWGVADYFNENGEETKQASAKIILGVLAILASFLAKNRR